MRYEWLQTESAWTLTSERAPILTISTPAGCRDVFENLSEGAYRWRRICQEPRDQMRMTVDSTDDLRYFMVPAVNYDGNGWGSGAQYTGFGADGETWTYAWHRTSIPACTYAESQKWSVSLFGEEAGGMSCSIQREGGKARQSLLWPEQEGPKVLFKRCWLPRFQGNMVPRQEFTAILFVTPTGRVREGYHALLDFAWTYFQRDVSMPYPPQRVRELDTLYFRAMYQKLYDGVTGFQSGKHWVESENDFVKVKWAFEMGWVGQNISIACLLLERYLETGDGDLKAKALNVLDSWVRFGQVGNGLMFVALTCDPAHVDSAVGGDIPITFDANGLGFGATYFFRAWELAEKAGEPRDEYRAVAMNICDFAVGSQGENGEFAKSWFMDGSVDAPHGAVGCVLALPLLTAYRLTGESHYLDGAVRAFQFYYQEFMRAGYTVAGALDSNCVDKESSAPLLRCALALYRVTGDRWYVEAAENLAYYLATWQWHYTVAYPKESMLGSLGFDTYGSTAVSAAHNALDHYGVYWVPEYLELARLTGNDAWRSRARALWYGGTQLLSDGTLVVKGRVRPAGSQDESIRHTRWGRPDKKYFTTSEWLTVWQGSYREVTLDMLENWDDLR